MYEKIYTFLFLKPWPIWKYLWRLQAKTHPLVLPMITLIIISTFTVSTYSLTNHFSESRDYSTFDSKLIIDDKIPFIKHTILIYGIYYLLFSLMAFSTPLRKKGLIECIFANQILFILSSLCFMIFMLVPIKIDTRIGINTGEGLIASFYDTLYLADPPFNSWPSLHVVHSIFLSGIIIRWMKISQGVLRFPNSDNKRLLLFKEKIFPIIMWIICASIIISTMTTKQHYFFDIVTGIIVGFAGIYIMNKCIKTVENNTEELTKYLES